MDESEFLVPANRAGPIRPKSSSLFLLTQPGHNSNIYNSSKNKISSTSYLFAYSRQPIVTPKHRITYPPYSIHLGEKILFQVMQKSKVLNLRCVDIVNKNIDPAVDQPMGRMVPTSSCWQMVPKESFFFLHRFYNRKNNLAPIAYLFHCRWVF